MALSKVRVPHLQGANVPLDEADDVLVGKLRYVVSISRRPRIAKQRGRINKHFSGTVLALR
jgi:hypothetical protein